MGATAQKLQELEHAVQDQSTVAHDFLNGVPTEALVNKFGQGAVGDAFASLTNKISPLCKDLQKKLDNTATMHLIMCDQDQCVLNQ